jgi:hypothetical protein
VFEYYCTIHPEMRGKLVVTWPDMVILILIITDKIIIIDVLTQRLPVKKYISSPNTYGHGSLIPRWLIGDLVFG